jgi:uncharacterized protein (DUF1800 family)
MSQDKTQEAALALHRFGLGPRPGSIAAIAADPRGALLAELDRPGAGRIDDARLLTAAQSSRAAFEARSARQAQKIVEERTKKQAEEAQARTMAMGEETKPDRPKPAPATPTPSIERQNFLKEVRARLDAALIPEIGFPERLVWFWSNHFCVSGFVVPNLTGGYEREAIRPYILGRFVDMLLAAEGHPAMLAYLNNNVSIGPNSVAGINRARGLNENLAREILELHTLGVRTGYSQDDVIRFANVLTGWTTISPVDNPEHGSEFIFNPRLHEPGPQQVMDKIYPDKGVEQGRAVLADLARHPATATHVATKLARHFVADTPPQPLVERLTNTFRDTNGDLKELAKTLITDPLAWEAPRDKLKTPCEWSVAITRALGGRGDAQRFANGLALLGQPLWRPSAPNGFADDEATWIDGLGRRLDIANAVGERVGERVEPDEMLDIALGPLATSTTRAALGRAESRQQALTLLFMSPEFQRR